MSDVLFNLINYIWICLEKLGNFLSSREVGLELIRIIMTAIFGFITFKIYQMYRNKKDNSNLYIQMIKLERELINNKDNLEKVIDGHTEYNSLKGKFIYKENNLLFKLYSQVNSLNSYVEEIIICEYSEPVDVEMSIVKSHMRQL